MKPGRLFLLTLIICLLVPVASFAQTFKIEQDTASAYAPIEEYAILNIDIYNESGSELTLAWKKIFDNYPSDWERSLCDYDMCYFNVPDSGLMNTLNSDQNGFLQLTIYAKAKVDPLVSRFLVYDVDNPGFMDTLTFIFNINTTSVSEVISSVSRLSPNPTEDWFKITNFNEGMVLSIYDQLGRLVSPLDYKLSPNGEVDVSQLKNGMYFVKLTSERNAQVIPFAKS